MEKQRHNGTMSRHFSGSGPQSLVDSILNSEIDDAENTWWGSSALLRNAPEILESPEQIKKLQQLFLRQSLLLELVEEKERKTIARSIHGDLGTRLALVMIQLYRLEKSLPPGDDSLIEQISSISDTIKIAIEIGQKKSAELQPKILESLGFVAAVKWLLDNLEKEGGIDCSLSSSIDDEAGFCQPVASVLFRVFKEALSNVEQHADASRVDVKLRKKGSRWILTVKDNGKGISRDQVLNSKSLGIIGMRERLRLIGGKIRIRGIEGHGTTVTMLIPQRNEQGLVI